LTKRRDTLLAAEMKTVERVLLGMAALGCVLFLAVLVYGCSGLSS
jgi:hypothetical protein